MGINHVLVNRCVVWQPVVRHVSAEFSTNSPTGSYCYWSALSKSVWPKWKPQLSWLNSVTTTSCYTDYIYIKAWSVIDYQANWYAAASKYKYMQLQTNYTLNQNFYVVVSINVYSRQRGLLWTICRFTLWPTSSLMLSMPYLIMVGLYVQWGMDLTCS